MTKQWTRRQFLQSMGVSAGVAMLANVGLPAVLAQDDKYRSLLQQSSHVHAPPQVELLCGDVIGFQLNSNAWDGDFGSVTFQMHKAWFDGNDVYYIRTDASDQAFSAENHLVFVPLLNAALAAEGSTSRLYTFEDATDGQYPVVSSTPAHEDYSPAWHVHRVTFSGTPSLLTSAAAIDEAAAAGDVTVEPLPLVVNFPIVKWDGGELAEDTEKSSYLGTGPLINPVDVDNMQVVFKLHQCYPGSRYIVTDTSAVPMAPMMSIAPSGPTGLLADVGATDEIWVFGNGIPGSGVMGYQPAVFDHSAGNPIWSPFWNHFTAVWTNEADAVVVTNSEQLRELVAAGALEVFNGTPNTHPTGFVVNCPVPIKAANDWHPDSM